MENKQTLVVNLQEALQEVIRAEADWNAARDTEAQARRRASEAVNHLNKCQERVDELLQSFRDQTEGGYWQVANRSKS